MIQRAVPPCTAMDHNGNWFTTQPLEANYPSLMAQRALQEKILSQSIFQEDHAAYLITVSAQLLLAGKVLLPLANVQNKFVQLGLTKLENVPCGQLLSVRHLEPLQKFFAIKKPLDLRTSYANNKFKFAVLKKRNASRQKESSNVSLLRIKYRPIPLE
jgi:hypothetical protein